jgi:hypothetical protein
LFSFVLHGKFELARTSVAQEVMKYQEGPLYTYFRKKALTLLSNSATIGREKDKSAIPVKILSSI